MPQNDRSTIRAAKKGRGLGAKTALFLLTALQLSNPGAVEACEDNTETAAAIDPCGDVPPPPRDPPLRRMKIVDEVYDPETGLWKQVSANDSITRVPAPYEDTDGWANQNPSRDRAGRIYYGERQTIIGLAWQNATNMTSDGVILDPLYSVAAINGWGSEQLEKTVAAIKTNIREIEILAGIHNWSINDAAENDVMSEYQNVEIYAPSPDKDGRLVKTNVNLWDTYAKTAQAAISARHTCALAVLELLNAKNVPGNEDVPARYMAIIAGNPTKDHPEYGSGRLYLSAVSYGAYLNQVKDIEIAKANYDLESDPKKKEIILKGILKDEENAEALYKEYLSISHGNGFNESAIFRGEFGNAYYRNFQSVMRGVKTMTTARHSSKDWQIPGKSEREFKETKEDGIRKYNAFIKWTEKQPESKLKRLFSMSEGDAYNVYIQENQGKKTSGMAAGRPAQSGAAAAAAAASPKDEKALKAWIEKYGKSYGVENRSKSEQMAAYSAACEQNRAAREQRKR